MPLLWLRSASSLKAAPPSEERLSPEAILGRLGGQDTQWVCQRGLIVLWKSIQYLRTTATISYRNTGGAQKVRKQLTVTLSQAALSTTGQEKCGSDENGHRRETRNAVPGG